MGNTPPSTSRDPIINFKWVVSEIADSEDLEQAWKQYSTLATGGKRDSNGEIIMYKDKAFLFVEHVAKQFEKKRNGIVSLEEALAVNNMHDAAELFNHQFEDHLTYRDFQKLFFTITNKLGVGYNKDLRVIYQKVGLDQNVYLHIYDLSEGVQKLNDYTLHLGFGAFHTGVEIFKRELSFGFPNGIFICKPKGASTGAVYRKTILMGTVPLTHQDVVEVIRELKDDWKGEDYDVINANCNHFCNALCLKLVGKGLPSYLTKIADFMSLFIKDSQDFGFLEGRGSMSHSQSGSLAQTPNAPTPMDKAFGPSKPKDTGTGVKDADLLKMHEAPKNAALKKSLGKEHSPSPSNTPSAGTTPSTTPDVMSPNNTPFTTPLTTPRVEENATKARTFSQNRASAKRDSIVLQHSLTNYTAPTATVSVTNTKPHRESIVLQHSLSNFIVDSPSNSNEFPVIASLTIPTDKPLDKEPPKEIEKEKDPAPLRRSSKKPRNSFKSSLDELLPTEQASSYSKRHTTGTSRGVEKLKNDREQAQMKRSKSQQRLSEEEDEKKVLGHSMKPLLRSSDNVSRPRSNSILEELKQSEGKIDARVIIHKLDMSKIQEVVDHLAQSESASQKSIESSSPKKKPITEGLSDSLSETLNTLNEIHNDSTPAENNEAIKDKVPDNDGEIK